MSEPDDLPKRRRRKQPLGQTIGGVLFGFEQQIWRNQPPPHELVHQARPDDPVPAGDGGYMTLHLPDPLPRPSAEGSAPEPLVRDLAERPTVAARIVQPMALVDVGALVGRVLPVVGARIEAAGLVIDGPPYVRYHDWGDQTADLEIGFPVRDDAAAVAALASVPGLVAGGVPGSSSLPGGPCAVLVHVGPYPDLPTTWGRLMTWIWDHDLEPAGAMWESHIDNPDLVDHAVLRTEVIRPVRG